MFHLDVSVSHTIDPAGAVQVTLVFDNSKCPQAYFFVTTLQPPGKINKHIRCSEVQLDMLSGARINLPQWIHGALMKQDVSHQNCPLNELMPCLHMVPWSVCNIVCQGGKQAKHILVQTKAVTSLSNFTYPFLVCCLMILILIF